MNDADRPLVLSAHSRPFHRRPTTFGLRGERTSSGLVGTSEKCQHLHGSKEACERHVRAWALLFNYRPWHTLEDTPDKCSPDSLKVIGTVLLAVCARVGQA